MASTTMSAWRTAVDPDDLREYDRFGPWIDKVEFLGDMPRRFRPWWPELGAADYVLKVPRRYDRAQVRPGMDLYESVIAVDRDRLSVLRAEVGEVVRRDVARSDVVASVRHTNLLYGRWSLLLADGGSVDMEINTVSQATVSEVDRFLMSSPDEGRWTATAAPVDEPQDHFFGVVIAALRSEEPANVRALHVEEPGQPCRTGRNGHRRSTGMMILQTPDDLLIFDRGRPTRSLWRPNYAANIVRIPFRRMTSFGLRRADPATPSRFSQLVITCDRQTITEPVLTPPETVVELLSARGVPQTM